MHQHRNLDRMSAQLHTTRTRMSHTMNINHLHELRASAIADDVAALNYRSWDGLDEDELDDAYLLLIPDPEHNNNGTLSGRAQIDLANTLRSGGWIFEGYKGTCVKPDAPRASADGKTIKYESPRGAGSQHLYVPQISTRVGSTIAAKAGLGDDYASHLADSGIIPQDAGDSPGVVVDRGFWPWLLSATDVPVIVTEGCKKACSLVSHGYAAIGLNGVWGWGTNVRDIYDEIERDDHGKALKDLHPDLLPYLDGRELVLAMDRDTKPDTVAMVSGAKAAFVRAVSDRTPTVSDLAWRGHKGIDDYIAANSGEALDRLYSLRTALNPRKGKDGGRSTDSDVLLSIAKTASYWHTPDRVAYSDIQIDGCRHTYRVRSNAYKLWLSKQYYTQLGKGAGSQSLQDCINTAEAIALFGSPTQEAHLRTAKHGDTIYIDLGGIDWRAIAVDATGWRVVSDPPVRFWRPDALLPLPVPVPGGNLEQLRSLLNVDRASWIAIVTYMLYAYCPSKTYPILLIDAQRGSGKSTAATILKGLIDPGKAALIAIPDSDRDAGVTASRRLLMVYDNVSHISAVESDRLCKLATGFGFATRRLHTDDDEITFDASRPQIITAIDGIVTRDDLADRVLVAHLDPIPDDRRLTQADLDDQIRRAGPQILGALMSALSQTLANIPRTHLADLPRMADYALFATAAEGALGLGDGEVMRVYSASRDRVRETVIESSPLGESILSLMRDRLVWQGTASELLADLSNHVDEVTYRSRYYPKVANHLKAQLNRLAPDLESLGIKVTDMRQGRTGTKKIVLEKVVKVSSASSAPPSSAPEPSQNKGSGADDGADDGIVSIVSASSASPASSAMLTMPSSALLIYPDPNQDKGFSFDADADDADADDGADDALTMLTMPSSACQTEARSQSQDAADDADDGSDNLWGLVKTMLTIGRAESPDMPRDPLCPQERTHDEMDTQRRASDDLRVGDRVRTITGRTGTVIKLVPKYMRTSHKGVVTVGACLVDFDGDEVRTVICSVCTKITDD